jgi:hypothetical protein
MVKKDSGSLDNSARKHYTPGSKLTSHLQKKERTISYNNNRNPIKYPTGNSHTIHLDRSTESSKYSSLHINTTTTTPHHRTSEAREDPVTRKYRETYGTSLVSKSKDKNSRKRSSQKKYELSDIYEKTYMMNQTISPYQQQNGNNNNVANGRRKLKSQRIGVDRGFGENVNTIEKIDRVDAIYKKSYLNRRLAYQ